MRLSTFPIRARGGDLAGLAFGLMALIGLWIGLSAWHSAGQAAIVIEWQTASELNTVGFHLYRAESPTGPFIQITSELIPAADQPLVGGSYRFTDQDVTAGRRYYYQLEDLERSGLAERHGVISAAAHGADPAQFVVSLLCLAVGIWGIVGWSRQRWASTAARQTGWPATEKSSAQR